MADNLLLKALPPETDYLNYLILLEHNLTIEQLPTLHEILQDTTLTANIGWDLVHLLLPFLPASQQCLQDVARLGNPREVVLKVTELLEHIGVEEIEDAQNDGADQEEEVGLGKLTITGDGVEAVAVNEGTGNDTTLGNPTPSTSKEKSKSVQFIALLELLSILHPRIKTKYPSRFLSTSLQAILPAYARVSAVQEATEAVLAFVTALSGRRRPRLPPRKSSNAVLLQQKTGTECAPDPEGKDEAQAPDEVALQNRLLQSFLTHITDDYMLAISAAGDISGLAWSSRLQEKLHPERLIPARKPYSVIFAEEDGLHGRDAVMGQIVALARDLKLSPGYLLQVVTNPESQGNESAPDLPSTASDVPLSYTGSLHLLSAMAAASALFDVPISLPKMQIFPEHTAIINNFIAAPETGGIGSEPETLLDSIVFLGSFILSNQDATLPPNDEAFTGLLQRLSLLSANTPSPTLRYHAHVLTSSLLHSHPSDHVRLAFIKDTLEHCPYENLKASAVGWLKDEILIADGSQHDHTNDSPSIFTTPTALTTLAPLLFPDLHPTTDQPPEQDHHHSFRVHQPFYLAVLNLYYLLLSSQSLFPRLEIARLTEDYNIREGFLQGLADVSRVLRAEISGEDEDEDEEALKELGLLDATIEMVRDAVLKTKLGGDEAGVGKGVGEVVDG